MEIDYFFSPISPYTYMGHDRFEAMAQRHGLTVRYRCMDTARVFAAAGTLPVRERPPARLAYRMMELKRWRRALGLPFHLEPRHFPVPETAAMRMVAAAVQSGAHPGALMGAVLRAVWEEQRDVSDPATLAAIAAEHGFDPDALAALAGGEAVSALVEADTELAISAQVFGVPTWRLGEELFWGQDRLDFLEAAVRGA